jgi:uncharacterized protein
MMLWNAFAAHYWTVAPALRHIVWPISAPPSLPWSALFTEDGRAVRAAGRRHEQKGADTLVVILHGLGGTPDSHYCVRAARAVHARGWSCLRLALRGADGEGDDFYHAGLTGDLRALLRSAEVLQYRRRFVVGYSLGGHVALRALCGAEPLPVDACAAICAPLDLTLGADALDARARTVYRRHILAGLKKTYAQVALRADVPTPVERVRLVGRIREWDALTIVPRFGFADVDDYYRRASVGSRLASLNRPTLFVYCRYDPLVPAETVVPSLAALPKPASVWWLDRGGHAGFPPRVKVNRCAAASVEEHVLDWLASRST